LAGYILNGVATNMALGLHITKRTGWLPIATGLAAVTNIVLLFVLVPHFGIYGGAWATFFAYAISAGILWRISMNAFPIPYEWTRCLGTVIVTVLLYAASVLMEFNGFMNGILLIAFPTILFTTGILNSQEKQFIKRVFGNKS